MSTPLLKVTDLNVHYGPALSLSNISFELGSRQSIAVLGSNGAGKSTLARVLSGLVQATSGTIELEGHDLTHKQGHVWRRAGVVHLPEGRGVFRGLTVMDNLRMALAAEKGIDKNAALAHAFEIFPVLGNRRRQLAGTLSGGEQQMLSLARALMIDPKVVIADEMSLGLAPRLVDVVFDGLERARDKGVAVIMIEQFASRALEFADDALILQRGTLAWSGPASEVGDELTRSYLGEGAVAV
ncbi:ATP-binding cassette domain-containing protein [Nocardioides sp. dk4132]|uniref:ABC transporter ATP-binding protein n=1 Tax=unclassified Nocardioides TaxID=2615069 RepID=UPI0012977919|nr:MULTISPECIES: ABC transporter ATP-binding protein [unclassified Nocardioides]MQW77611.1 ATP-binding cassette domain-containing protein [Nocardioides sp. dk4132]QGA06137.1 ATP-binding cassette domain-containing protein [Nocardioides sp. dk884]